MPIIFISLNKTFVELIRTKGYEAHMMQIQDFKPSANRKTYYVSPANSLCFMDGGIDLELSRNIFPGIESKVKSAVRELNRKNILGRYYLPIGSSIIIDDGQKSLIVAPTMLLPQDVSKTQNAYYATMAILYNILINRKESLTDCDIIFTSLCCGYGKMDEVVSIQQILDGLRDYREYHAQILNSNTILAEPNLLVQPKLYQNTEWFSISPQELI